MNMRFISRLLHFICMAVSAQSHAQSYTSQQIQLISPLAPTAPSLKELGYKVENPIVDGLLARKDNKNLL
jgi:tripartite-type tricarboxylate transporter receptor subunit TctC